ncbi:15-hydroxyprostaglandin dehydrogenase [NAD(+)]-like [Chrysoperla carnea]|uniref:15-hydroxyprostaglandin dehydrogenase [NAD(+)]-like n=1 Tax=Chrysoperla carnea TaxID=189513 RepID=UPI001D077076|nr:15-hydroxyprostaglandin dehydrogenase [NAD(+)]-like [Chrysoperla carnea]
MNTIEDCVCFVTGGAGGIGYEIVKKLIEAEAKMVYIGDWNEEKGRVAVVDLTKDCRYKKAQFINMDVTDAAAFENAIKKIIGQSAQLDLIINNAGVLESDRTIDVNIKGAYTGSELGMKYLSKGGRIINVSSTWGFYGIGEIPRYVAASHAIIGMSRSFAGCYWHKQRGISVLTFCVGPTSTDFIANLKNNEKYLSDRERAVLRFYSQFTLQSPEVVAGNLIRVLNYGENGQVWVSESCEPLYEIDIPNYQNWKIKHNYMLFDENFK